MTAILDAGVDELAPIVGHKRACDVLGRSRASHYRQQQDPFHGPPRPRHSPEGPDTRRSRNRGRDIERGTLLRQSPRPDMGHPARRRDLPGISLDDVSPPARTTPGQGTPSPGPPPPLVTPELVATGPNQVWSWDITKLAGPYKWTWYQLYTILDIYTRYVVGWLIAPTESAKLAEQLIADAIYTHHVDHDQLTLHADRGSSMTSRTVSQLLADLGVLQSHSRPHQSNDNPYSEAQFKTLKYSPTFPKRFANIAQARAFCETFFHYYNNEHRHSGIGYNTPANVYYGLDDIVRQKRQGVLDTAYTQHPEHFTKPPQAPQIPQATWTNRPEEEPTTN